MYEAASQKQYLSGGRVTQGVYLLNGAVHRPRRPNSEFVARALDYARANGLDFVPRYMGVDADGFDMFSYMEGTVPANLGDFSDAQLRRAAELISRFHSVMRGFVGDGRRSVCHNDLSPCNFTFTGGMPAGIIDFDACAPGDPLDDLAYALWMWLDIGNPDQPPEGAARRMALMCGAYGCADELRRLPQRMLAQMRRVERSVFSDPEQTARTSAWARGCAVWLEAKLIPLLGKGA